MLLRATLEMRTNPNTSRFLAALAAFGMCLLTIAPLAAAADPTVGQVGWQPVQVAGPSARSHAAVAFDGATGTTVLYGGRAGSTVLGDTWTWDGKTWTAQKPSSSPPHLQSASMVYDEATQQLLLFGGLTDRGAPSAATWVWTGQSWQQFTLLSTPPARYDASLVYDPVTRNAVLFGGIQSGGKPLADTWEWNGLGWSVVAPASSPPARAGAGAAFDAAHGVVVVFGGTSAGQLLSDTWTWDGGTWTEHSSSVVPAPRLDPAMAFDPVSGSTVLFGGAASGGVPVDDTWKWDGASWVRSQSTSASPAGRSGATLVAAPGVQSLILFGGAELNGVVAGDMWVLTPLSGAVNQPSSTTSVPPGPASIGTTTSNPNPPPTTPPQALGSAPNPARSSPLGLTARTLHKGDQLTLSGSGFEPGTQVTIEFHSTPSVLAVVRANDRGDFTTTVTVPTDASPGTHHFVATGAAPNGAQNLLTAPISVVLPARAHDWVLPALMVALTIVLAVGAATVLTLSSRWPERPEGTSPA
jgi:hypothetical protein